MSEVHISVHPLVKCKLTQLRDKATGPKMFRDLVRELSMLLAYEACADMEVVRNQVATPLATMLGWYLKDKVGLVPILRAGLGMADGVQDLIPDAQVWHVGLYRDEETLCPVPYYNKLPDKPTVDVCIVLDPMIATGGSAVATVDSLKKWGVKRIKFIGLIAASEGVRNLNESHPDVPIYLASLDECLNEFGYILPGCGDAGHRQFGTG
ncbi:uracil phosphoribosyltransferase [Candidatus Uhrbacteria bacterium]|nr:uracil phosphoribosyltransferase [Candidatus Uhrbacteria bacterium]